MAAAAATGGSLAAGNRNIAKNSRIRNSLQLGAPGEHDTIESAFCNRMVKDFDGLNAESKKSDTKGGTPASREKARDELDDRRHAIRRALIYGAEESIHDNIYNEYNMPAITTAAYLLGSIGLCNPENPSYADLRGVLWPPFVQQQDGQFVTVDAPDTAYWRTFLKMFETGTSENPIITNIQMGLGPMFAWHTNAIAAGTFAIMYKYHYLRTVSQVEDKVEFVKYYYHLQRRLHDVFGHPTFFDVAPGPALPFNSMGSLQRVTKKVSHVHMGIMGIHNTELFATADTINYILECKTATGEDVSNMHAFDEVVASSREAGLLSPVVGDNGTQGLSAKMMSAKKKAQPRVIGDIEDTVMTETTPPAAGTAAAIPATSSAAVTVDETVLNSVKKMDASAARDGTHDKSGTTAAALAAAPPVEHANDKGESLKKDMFRFTPRPVYDFLRFSHLLAVSRQSIEYDSFMASCSYQDKLPACYSSSAEKEDAAYWKYHYDVCARLFGWSEGKSRMHGSTNDLAKKWSKHDGTGIIDEFGALLWAIRMASAAVDRLADITPAGMHSQFLGQNSNAPAPHLRVPAVSFGHIPLRKYTDVIDGTDAYAEQTNEDRAKLVPAIVRNMYRMSGDAEDLVSLIAKVHRKGVDNTEGVTGAVDSSYETPGNLGSRMLNTFTKRLLVDTVAGQLLGLTRNLAQSIPTVELLCADEYKEDDGPMTTAMKDYDDTVAKLLAPGPGNKPVSPQLHAELLENLTVGAFTDTASTAFSVLAEVAAGCKTMGDSAPLTGRLYWHWKNIRGFLTYKPDPGSPSDSGYHVARLTRGIGSVARFSIPLKLAIIQDFLMDEATAGRVGEGELTFKESVAAISNYLTETVPSDEADYLEKPAHRLWALKRVWDVLFPPSGEAPPPPPWKVLACVEQFGHFSGESPMVVLGPAVANIVTQRCVYSAKNASLTDKPSIPTRSGLVSSGAIMGGDDPAILRNTYAMYDHLCETSVWETQLKKAWSERNWIDVIAYTEHTHALALAMTGQVPGSRGNHPHDNALAFRLPLPTSTLNTENAGSFPVPAALASLFKLDPSTKTYPIQPTADIMRAIVENVPRAVMYPRLHGLPYTLANLLFRVNAAADAAGRAGGRRGEAVLPPLVYSDAGGRQYPWGGLPLLSAEAMESVAARRSAGAPSVCPVGKPSEIIAMSNASTPAYFVHAAKTADISGIGDVVPTSLTGAGELWVETTLRSSAFMDSANIIARVGSYVHPRVVRARAVFEEGGAYDRAMAPVKKELLDALENRVQATVAEYTSALNAFHQDPAYAVWREIRDRVYGSEEYRDNPIAAVAEDSSPGLNQVYGPVRAAVAAAAKRIEHMFEAPPGTAGNEKREYGKSTACTTSPIDKASGFVQQKFVGAHMSPAQPSPGLLLWHSAGSGKTICGVNAVNNFIYGPPGGSRNGSTPAATWNVIWVVPDATARQQLILDMFKYADRRRDEDGLPRLADDVNEAEREFGKRFRYRWRKNPTISAAAIAAGAVYNGTASEEDGDGGGATYKTKKKGAGAAAGAKNGSSESLGLWRIDKELDGADVAAKLVLTYEDFAKFVNGVYAERLDRSNSSGSGYPEKIAADYYLTSEAYHNVGGSGAEVTDVLRETLLVFDEFQNVFAEGAGGAHAGALTPAFRVNFMSLLNESRAKSGPLACKLLAFSATPEGTHTEMAIPDLLDEEYAGTKDTLARMLQIIQGPVMEMIPPKAGEDGRLRYQQIYPIEADASKPLVPETRGELRQRFPKDDRVVNAIIDEGKRAGGGGDDKVVERLREEFIRRYITPCVSYFDSSGSPLLMPQIRYVHEPVALLGPMSSFVMVDAIDTTGVAIEAFASILRGSSGLTRTAMFTPALKDKLESLVPNTSVAKRIAAYKRRNIAK